MSGKTSRQWLIDAAKLLKDAEVEHPHLVAEIILSKAIKRERASVIAHADELLSDEDEQNADDFLQKRVSGVPLSYVLEETEFFSLAIRVTPAVLVPEAETEHLVQAVLDIAASDEFKNVQELQIVDIGTGSGCILAAIAVNDARFTGFGVDISKDALEIAEYNLKKHKIIDRFKLVQSDIFASLTSKAEQNVQKFDFIVSNPPYIAEYDRETLRKEVLTQPKVALFGGSEGTEFTQKLIQQSVEHIQAGGYLILEIGQGTYNDIIEIATHIGYVHLNTINDYTNIERILVFQMQNPLRNKM